MAASKKGISKSTMVSVGAGAATAAVAAAAAYWFYGAEQAAKHRKTARSWMLQARGDVLSAVEKTIEKVGEIDKATYMGIVDGVLKRYQGLSSVTSAEILQATRDMSAAWQHMQKARKNTAPKKVKTATKKAVKKARA